MYVTPRYSLSQNSKENRSGKINVLLNKTRPIKIIINILSIKAHV